MNPLIMVVVDGLRSDTAESSMGYMNLLVEKNIAAYWRVKSELPSLSRPLYEVLLTGTPATVNGITTNSIVRLSEQKSLFHLVKEQGGATAAAAYHWVSELYNKAPFDPLADREQHEPSRAIQHGLFYFDDTYPDSHCFADAEALRRRYRPDFLYVHPMGVDDIGHRYGSDSKEYRGKVLQADSLLATVIPIWLSAGYQIVVTADHGMNRDGHHGGTGSDVRDVPLFCISGNVLPGKYEEQLPQLSVAPFMCRLMSLAPSANMMTWNTP